MWYKIVQGFNAFIWVGTAVAVVLWGGDGTFPLVVGGFYVVVLIVVNEVFRQSFSALKYVLSALTFLGFGLFLWLLSALAPVWWRSFQQPILMVAGVLCSYAMIYILFKAPSGIGLGMPKAKDLDRSQYSEASPKLIDTSAIIDGRIADICETGFIEGIFVIPKFVINELQLIADSSDMIKRTKGRRGLDIVKEMQSSETILIQIADIDYKHVRGVDAKLVEMAKETGGYIVTNDYNLNKIAQIQNITVLNINDLANCVKSKMITGDERKVTIVKSGKDQNQGVAYLEDGTMIVVENGRSRIGKTVPVIVTSVLQTSAGRMIFARIK